jgi:hypothetical protein
MSKETFHVQCKLSRIDTSSDRSETVFRTAYLPEKYAKQNAVVLIDEDPDTSYRWQVLDVYNRLPSSEVNERGQDYKRTRKASDV